MSITPEELRNRAHSWFWTLFTILILTTVFLAAAIFYVRVLVHLVKEAIGG